MVNENEGKPTVNEIKLVRILRGLTYIRELVEEFSEDAKSVLDHGEVDYTKVHHPNVSDEYEKELIQVAASAVAALTDSIMAKLPDCSSITESEVQSLIFEKIKEERLRQDRKFDQTMPRRLSPLIWIAVIFEELGEVAQEIEA